MSKPICPTCFMRPSTPTMTSERLLGERRLFRHGFARYHDPVAAGHHAQGRVLGAPGTLAEQRQRGVVGGSIAGEERYHAVEEQGD